MCGRFVASRPVDEIADILDVDDIEVPSELIEPRWNISPQADVLGVTLRRPKPDPEADPSDPLPEPRRRLTVFHWGLVPSWAKDPSVGNKMFNARAETLQDKGAFRTALERRRCLVPADAFYEWEKIGGAGSGSGGRGRVRRRPWVYKDPDGELLTFAGLWEAWRPRTPDPETGELHEWLLSCTIITTDANEVVAPVHDRMPVVIAPEDRSAWLAPDALEAAEVHALLRPAPAATIIAFPVSNQVSDSRAEGPQLAEPLPESDEDESQDAPEPQQGALFDSL